MIRHLHPVVEGKIRLEVNVADLETLQLGAAYAIADAGDQLRDREFDTPAHERAARQAKDAVQLYESITAILKDVTS